MEIQTFRLTTGIPVKAQQSKAKYLFQAIVKDKNKDSNKKMIENAPTAGKQNSNTYYNSGADDEIKGNSTYDAYKNYLITVKPDGQEGAYTHTTHSD